MEFKVAYKVTPRAEVTTALRISRYNNVLEPGRGNQLTPERDKIIGRLILRMTSNAEPIKVYFLSNLRVAAGIMTMETISPTKLPKGMNFSCSVVIPQK